MTDQQPIRCMHEHLVYENEFARVYDDTVAFPDGDEGRYLRVQPVGRGPGVVILPFRSGYISVVRTYRYPVGEWQWALPRGFSQGPDPLETARSELREEMGVTEARVRLLGHITPDSGLLASRIAVVLAEIEDPWIGPTDFREVVAVRWVGLTALEAEVAEGQIEDGLTLAALALARARGDLD